MHFSKKDIFAIPNILTYVRILLVPVFVVVYMNAQSLSGHVWSIVIVAISALTDIVDGVIARKCNMITDLGKIIDPIADKAMQFAMLFCVVYKYHWILLLIVIYAVKEVVSLIFSSFLFSKGKHIAGAMWCGKICTVILYGVMLALIAFPHVVTILIGFSAAFMLLAFFVYMTAYLQLYKEYKKEQKENKKEE